MEYLVNKKFFTLSFILIIFFFIYFFQNTTNYTNFKLNWDEVDYANVASKGIINNYIDRDSLSFQSFIEIGLSKFYNKELSDNKNLLVLEQNDNFNLRHFHPPLPVYYWSIFASDKNSNEINAKNLRFGNLFLYFIVFVYFTIITHLNTINIKNYFLSISLLFFYITNTNVIEFFLNLQFHTFFSIIFFYHIYSVIKYFKEKNNVYSRINFIFSISLLVITLETFPIVLIATIFIYFFFPIENKKEINLFELIKNFIAAIIIAIILFPSSIIKLTYFKTFLMYFYRIFVNNNDEYSEINYLDNWKNLFFDNLLVFSVIIFVLLFQFFRKKIEKKYFIYFFYIFFYSIIITPFILSYTYVFPAIFILISVTILILNKTKLSNYGFALFSSIFIIAIFVNFLEFNKKNYFNDFEFYNNKIDIIISRYLVEGKNSKILIDGAHIFNYYSENTNFTNLNIMSLSDPSFYIRENYKNLKINDQIKNNYFDTIIIQSNRKYSDEKIKFLHDSGYKSLDNLKGYNVYKLDNE